MASRWPPFRRPAVFAVAVAVAVAAVFAVSAAVHPASVGAFAPPFRFVSLSSPSPRAFVPSSKRLIFAATNDDDDGDEEEEEVEEEEATETPNDDDDGAETTHYDDFAGTTIGGGSSSSSSSSSVSSSVDLASSSLAERIRESRYAERKRDARLEKNWRVGNWKVRGFRLDESDAAAASVPETTSVGKDDDDDDDADAGGRVGGGRKIGRSGGRSELEGLFAGGGGGGGGTPSAERPDASESAKSPGGGGGGGSTPPPPPIRVSTLAFDSCPSSIGDSLVVGRTDGSVILVKLGTEYLTRFQSVPKLAMGPVSLDDDGDGGDDEDAGDDEGGGATTVRIGSELVDAEALRERSRREGGGGGPSVPPAPEGDAAAPAPFDEYGVDFGAGDDDDDDDIPTPSSSSSFPEGTGSPFRITHQFRAHEIDEPVTSVLYDDDVLCTAGGTSGDIKVWRILDDMDVDVGDDGKKKRKKKGVMPLRNLSDVHSSRVVSLRTLSSSSSLARRGERDLLLSASIDGSFALWDATTGDLVRKCRLCADDGSPVSILAADVDDGDDDCHVVYLGSSDGKVRGYAVSELIEGASEGGEGTRDVAVPNCEFVATNEGGVAGVSAIKCGGEGTTGKRRSSGEGGDNVKSSILLTGGEDGSVKQWEMMKRKMPRSSSDKSSSSSSSSSSSAAAASPSTIRLDRWPLLPTQRTKRRAHLFDGHSDAVTSFAVRTRNGGNQFLSSSRDGTVRVWDAKRGGAELFRMDGFDDDVGSLCLYDESTEEASSSSSEVLVTDGMGGCVCLHDFDVDDGEVEDGYELEW